MVGSIRTFILLFFALCAACCSADEQAAAESAPAPMLINMTALPSSIVNGSVNVITGDYLIADVDYSVSAPDPYVLGHSYSSANLEPGSLARGWNFHHQHMLEVFQKDGVGYDEKGGECNIDDVIPCIIEPLGGRIALKCECDDDHQIPRLDKFKVITKNTGFTNVLGGEISGQTNIKNIDVDFDRHENEFTVVLGDGTRRVYTPMWKKSEMKHERPHHTKYYRDYQVHKEVLPSGNMFTYHYDDDHQISHINCYNRDFSHKLAEIDFEKKGRKLHVKTSDDQEVIYTLKKAVHHSNRGNYTVSAIEKPGLPKISFSYSKKSDNYDKRVTRQKNDDGYYVETKYYRNADSKVGSETVKPKSKKERHFLQNRVRMQRSPIGPGNKKTITHRYFYEKKDGDAGYCTVCDAYNTRTKYVWNKDRRLVKIVKRGSGKERPLLMKETFVWGTDKEDGYLIARNLFDEEDKPKLSRVFEYDHHGNIKSETLYGKFCSDDGALKLEKGLPHHSTCDKLETSYTYSHDGLNLKTSECDPLGNYTYYAYHKGTNLLKSKFSCDGKDIKKREFYEYDKNAILIEEIVDDGSKEGKDDLHNVTERHIKRITPRTERPHFGEPEVIEEYCLKGKKERLIKKTVHSYDKRGFLSKTKIYDADQNLASTSSYEHDEVGRITYSKDALGREEFYSYDKSGRLKKKSGPRTDLTTRYEYDIAGRLIKETEEQKNGPILSTCYEYDLLGRKVAVTNPQNQTTRYEYDRLDRLTKVTYPTTFDHEGKAVTPIKSYSYKKLGTIIVEKDELGHSTTTTYNAAGKIFARTLADGTTWSYRYDKKGNPIREETPTLARHYMRYDAFNRLKKSSLYKNDTFLERKEYSYNTFHLIKELSPTKEKTLYTYDFAGRKKKQTLVKDKVSKQTSYLYDRLSRLAEERVYTTKTDYVATCFSYDALNRKVTESTKDPQGTVLTHKTFGYDQEGNLAEVSESIMGKIATTKTTYYPHGIPREQVDAEGNTYKYFYDYHFTNVHRQKVIKKTTIDPRGVIHEEVLDTRGNLSCSMHYDPLGTLLTKQELYYDTADNLVRTHDHAIQAGKTENVITHTFTYGPLDRLEALTEALNTPEQKTTRYLYNAYGQKKATIHADGTKLLQTYDAKGRVKEYRAEDKSLHYEYAYDASDRILSITNHLTGKKTERHYDPLGDLASEKLESGLELHLKYDRAGRLSALTLPDSSAVHYSYNAFLQQVTRVSANKEPLWRYEITKRDLSGHIASALLPKNAGSINYDYDLLGRRSETSHPAFTEQALKFDATGNLLEVKRDGKSSVYSYDCLSQLTSEAGHASHSYTYDSLYNRRSLDDATYTINSLHSVLSDGKQSFQYDQRANRLQSDDTKYRYDALDRLIEVEKGDRRYVYSYDALDRRMQKETFVKKVDDWVSQDVEKYLYHLQNEIGSTDRSGKIKELRILGEGLGAEIGATVAIELQDKLYVTLNDRRGNIVAMLNPETAQVAESYHYDAFGNETVTSTTATGNPWRFASKRVDPETGLVYFGRRYYDPALGKWLTHDPLGLKAGPNLYAYVLNNPLTMFDLYGLLSVEIERMNQLNGGEYHNDAYESSHDSPRGERTSDNHPFYLTRDSDSASSENGVSYETPSHPFSSPDYWNDKDFYYEDDEGRSSWHTALDYGLSALDGVCLASDVYAVYALLSCNPAGIISAIAAKSASLAAKVVTKLVRSQICGRVALPGVKGAVKAGRPILKNVLPNLDQLSKAGQAFDRNGLTKAGRALQKHGGRPGSPFPKPKGNIESVNTQGQKTLNSILNHPNRTTHLRYKERYGHIMDIHEPAGCGARFSQNGDFIGFLDP